MITDLVAIVASLLPVLVFLAVLVYLDSYKLVPVRVVLITIGVGVVVAAVAMGINKGLLEATGMGGKMYARSLAPAVEELLKSVYVVYLLRSRRVGFVVDAAIHGFAIGAGFAIIENLYYLQAIGDAPVVTWFIRGFGTAVLHGGATSLFAMIAKGLLDRDHPVPQSITLALLLAIALHTLYNNFVLPPLVSVLVLYSVFPLLITVVFYHSERATNRWLGNQFDTDQELLDIINSGAVAESRIGEFFESAREQFPPEMLVDMLCYLRIHVELAISAKGMLLLREAGFEPPVDESVRSRFAELVHLKKSLGRTGLLAIQPFLHTNDRDLWQLHMLDQQSR